jgi:hypothetical protein
VITANIKLNVTVGGEQYLLHVVGLAKGYFDNATINKLVSLLNQSKSPEVLLSVFKTLADYNKTKELKVKAMLTARHKCIGAKRHDARRRLRHRREFRLCQQPHNAVPAGPRPAYDAHRGCRDNPSAGLWAGSAARVATAACSRGL